MQTHLYFYDLNAIITVTLSIISIVSSVIMVIALVIIGQIAGNSAPRVKLLRAAVLWMSISDIFWSIYMALDNIQFIHLYLSAKPIPCALVVFFSCGFELASISWYFVIAVMTYRILSGSSATLNLTYCHFFVWGFSWMSMIFGGVVAWACPTSILPPITCEAKRGSEMDIMSLFLYVPIICYMMFSLYLIGYACIMIPHLERPFGNSPKTHNRPETRTRAIMRMMGFIGVFIAVWILPVVDRSWDLVMALELGKRPIWLRNASHFSKACVGLANFLIWITSRPFQALWRYYAPQFCHFPVHYWSVRLFVCRKRDISELDHPGKDEFSEPSSLSYRYRSGITHSGVLGHTRDDGSAEGKMIWEDPTGHLRPALDKAYLLEH